MVRAVIFPVFRVCSVKSCIRIPRILLCDMKNDNIFRILRVTVPLQTTSNSTKTPSSIHGISIAMWRLGSTPS